MTKIPTIAHIGKHCLMPKITSSSRWQTFKRSIPVTLINVHSFITLLHKWGCILLVLRKNHVEHFWINDGIPLSCKSTSLQFPKWLWCCGNVASQFNIALRPLTNTSVIIMALNASDFHVAMTLVYQDCLRLHLSESFNTKFLICGGCVHTTQCNTKLITCAV
jgi:hypothetical protein